MPHVRNVVSCVCQKSPVLSEKVGYSSPSLLRNYWFVASYFRKLRQPSLPLWTAPMLLPLPQSFPSWAASVRFLPFLASSTGESLHIFNGVLLGIWDCVCCCCSYCIFMVYGKSRLPRKILHKGGIGFRLRDLRKIGTTIGWCMLLKSSGIFLGFCELTLCSTWEMDYSVAVYNDRVKWHLNIG